MVPSIPGLSASLRLLRPLAEGNRRLWVARHEVFAVDVLVKLGAPEELPRFERARSASFRLRSPHALRIFEHGQASDGSPFLVAELLEGRDLARELARRALAPQEVLTLGRQLARCLGAAHAQGIPHGALRPSDVFLCAAADGDSFVKLLGFGKEPPWPGSEQRDLSDLAELLFAALTGQRSAGAEGPLPAWLRRAQDGAFASAQDLYNALHDALAPRSPPRREIPLRHRIPSAHALFVGRSRELDALAALLKKTPVVVLQGPAGVGTSALAFEVLHRHFPERTPGALRVSFRAGESRDTPALSLLRALVQICQISDFGWASVAGSPDALMAAAIDLAETEDLWVLVEDLHLAEPRQAEHLLRQLARYARTSRWLISTCRPFRDESLIGRVLALAPLDEGLMRRLAQESRPELPEPQRSAAVARARGCPGALLRLLLEGEPEPAEDPGAERSLVGLLLRCGQLPEPLARACAEALSPLGPQLLDALERRGAIRREQGAVVLLDREAPPTLPLLAPATLQALSALLEEGAEPPPLLLALELRLEARDHAGARALLDRAGGRLLALGYAAELYERLHLAEAPELDHPRLSCAVQLGDTAALTAPAPRSRAPEDLLLWASLLLARRDIPGSLAVLDRLPPALAPAPAFEAVFLRACCLANSDQPQAAVAALQAAPATQSEATARARSMLAALQANHGARDEALRSVEQARAALGQLPEQERKRVAAGVVHTLYALGQLRDADDVLERCLVAPASTRLGHAHQRDPARFDMERRVRYMRAVVAAELGDLDDAQELLEQLGPYLGPTSLMRPYIALMRAWILVMRGQLPELEALQEELRPAQSMAELTSGIESFSFYLKILRRLPPDRAERPEPSSWASTLHHQASARRALHQARWGVLAPQEALAALAQLQGDSPENDLVCGVARAECLLLSGQPGEAARLAASVAEDALTYGFALRELDARAARCDALLCAGHTSALRTAAAELQKLARRVRSPRFEAVASLHGALAAPERIDAAAIESLGSLAQVAPEVALRARALLGDEQPLDLVDRAVIEATLASGRWQPPRRLGPAAAPKSGWGLDEARREVWLPDGSRVSFLRHDTLWRLLATLAHRGGSASKEQLACDVWGERSYHPLLHDNRLQAAVRKIRLRIEADPSRPERLLTTEAGYALGGVVRTI